MKRALDRLRSFLLWAIALPVFILMCFLILAAAPIIRGHPFERLVKAGCTLLLFCCGVRVRVQGRENFRADRQYILVMNHVNLLDAFVFYAGFPGWARGIEEESHFRWPLYGIVLRRLGTIPIHRRNSKEAKKGLRRAAELIRRRKDFSLLVLPEGTRTRTGKLGPFKRGAFLLALEAGLDILPIVQVGARRINRKGSLHVRPGRVDYFIEPPIPIAGTTLETLGDLIDRVRAVYLSRVEG
jgi:1-acyl-sn-glycerol-3-phosphate acyltransferase